MTATETEIEQHFTEGSWRRLQCAAVKIVRETEARVGAPITPRFGGSGRMMLDLRHRISDDLDLFLRDPQWIAHLSPRSLPAEPSDVRSFDEGSATLKLLLAHGEVDFIVAPSLLGLPDEHSEHSPFALEPIGEVLAKKLFYRGWAMVPRDLFDWWYVSTHAPERIPDEQIALLIASRQSAIRWALAALATNSAAVGKWDQLRTVGKPTLSEAAEWARRQLLKYDLMAQLAQARPAEGHD
jgi:hypothetical protein